MKTALSALAMTGLLLGTLGCGHKEAQAEAKVLPKVAVALVAQGSPEDFSFLRHPVRDKLVMKFLPY